MNLNDDIVSQLRHLDKHFTEQWGTPGYPVVGAAADEIERLRAEVNTMACAQDGWGQLGRVKAENERLRQVGDKLAMHLDGFFGMLEPASNEITEVLKEWRET